MVDVETARVQTPRTVSPASFRDGYRRGLRDCGKRTATMPSPKFEFYLTVGVRLHVVSSFLSLQSAHLIPSDQTGLCFLSTRYPKTDLCVALCAAHTSWRHARKIGPH